MSTIPTASQLPEMEDVDTTKTLPVSPSVSSSLNDSQAGPASPNASDSSSTEVEEGEIQESVEYYTFFEKSEEKGPVIHFRVRTVDGLRRVQIYDTGPMEMSPEFLKDSIQKVFPLSMSKEVEDYQEAELEDEMEMLQEKREEEFDTVAFYAFLLGAVVMGAFALWIVYLLQGVQRLI